MAIKTKKMKIWHKATFSWFMEGALKITPTYTYCKFHMFSWQ